MANYYPVPPLKKNPKPAKAAAPRKPAAQVQYFVTLTDVTPNRGTIAYYGQDEDEAREAAEAAGGDTRILREHPRSCEAMVLGERAWHDGETAWRTVGY